MSRGTALVILAVTLFLPAVAMAQAEPAQAEPAQAQSGSVLVINSYHRGYDWSDAEMSAIEDVIIANRPGVDLYFEYLDAKRIRWTDSRAEIFATSMAARYQDVRFGVIVCTDDIAYHFMLERRDALFPGVPVVFCGVNYFVQSQLDQHAGFTGVAQKIDFAGNIDLIRKILPSTKKIWAIVDASMTGKAYRKALETDPLVPPDIEIDYLDGSELSWKQVLEKLAILPPDSAVLKLIWLEDTESGYLAPAVSYPAIASQSAVPVFQVTESGLGLGLAGGLMVTGRSQGRGAALMALDILSGHSVASIPVVTEPVSELRIDWTALARHWRVSRQDFERVSEAQHAGLADTPPPSKAYYRVCLSNEPVVSQYNIISGGFTGLAVELLEVIAGRAGWKFGYVFAEPGRILSALNSGKCDVAMPVSSDEATLDKFDVSSEPLYSNWGAIYVQSGSSIAGLRDLQGLSVAVVVDSAFSMPFMRQIDSLGLNISYVWVDSYKEAVEMLALRNVDAALVGRLHPISPRQASRIAATDIIIYPVGQRMAVLKGDNVGFLAAFDKHLQSLRRDPSSDYGKVVARYTYRQNVEWVPIWVWFVLAALGVTLFFLFLLRRQVESKTRELSERGENIRVILNSIGDAVVATNRFGLVDNLNPVATILTGWDARDAAGQNLSDVVDIVDFESGGPREGWIDDVMAGNVVLMSGDGCPTLLNRRGGGIRVEISASPIRDEAQRVKGIVVVFRDVTESLRTEEIRRQSQKMEAIGQLAGGIAHDFNNVLGGVIGIAEFLISRYRLDPTIIKYCGYIVESGHRASLMIRRLLDFARMGKAESVAVSVNSVVAAAVEILKGSIPRSIEISTNLAATPDVIIGDASQIENLVLNLGINARDAMPEGGRIDISTSCCDPFPAGARIGRFVLSEGEYLQLRVGDTGVGISPSISEKIFEPFFTTKTTGKGTGLGLAAVMGIVEEHQGAIEVENRPDGGTLFTIYLPLTGGVSAVEPQVPTANITNYQGVVLVIDDEPIIRTMAEVLLTESGFDVITASDGREGLETYMKRRDEIDVVLLDFIMPVMDGLATLRELKAFDPDVKVVIASGFTSDHRRQSLLDAGAIDAVSKPFSQQEICAALINAVNHH